MKTQKQQIAPLLVDFPHLAETIILFLFILDTAIISIEEDVCADANIVCSDGRKCVSMFGKPMCMPIVESFGFGDAPGVIGRMDEDVNEQDLKIKNDFDSGNLRL
jgi:hypothetical protein